MKSLAQYLTESKGSSFEVEVKFPLKDFEAWKKHADKKVEIEEYDDFYGIYVGKKHIGSYYLKTQILATDDVSVFGKYID